MKTRRMTVLMLTLLLLLPAAGKAEEEPKRLTNSEGFVYVLDDEGSAEIVGYTGKEKKIVIPARVDGHPVVSIGKGAFENQNITSLTVPEGVTKIRIWAFRSCKSLVTVSLPQGLETLEKGVFSWCSKLKTVNLLESLTEIGSGILAGCSVLKDVTISDSHPLLEVKDGVLFTRTDHRLVWYPMVKKDKAYTVPDGTEIIGENAFTQSAVRRVTLPDSVATVADDAFFNCSKLSEVYVSAGTTELQGSAISFCSSLAKIEVAEGNLVYESRDGVLFDKTTHTLMKYPAARKGNTYDIPDGTLAIGDGAFQRSKLTEVNIPSGVKRIGAEAFYQNKKLKKIVIPEGVEEFGNGVFGYDSALTEVSLPRTLTKVVSNPFNECGKLKTVLLAEDHPALALIDGALVHTRDQRLLWYPQTAKEKEFTVPAGVRIIGRWAFAGCSRLNKVVLPEGVEELEFHAFNSCKGIKTFYLPASLKTIDKSALENDKGGLLNATYYVVSGSYAENYCTAYKVKTQAQ